ncbi:RDD family protein [Bradyrhizobium sp. HKCCYLS3077]|uniref:RDD family protein n=1 Tax=Bradyrhizobium sp. HKCCYLS3077 TaxID=3420761 RepID=UPI003EB95400
MSNQSLHDEFERAGVWRRAGAFFIDALLVVILLQAGGIVLFPLTHGRVQFADGIYATNCSKREAVPDGVAVPPQFNPTAILDCEHHLFGLPSARMLRVSRITQDGPITKEIHIDSMLDADGVPVKGLSLGIVLLPLLLGLRLMLDVRRGTPGRRICRLRLAQSHGDGPPPLRAARRRYGMLLLIFGPAIAWALAQSFTAVTALPEDLLFGIAVAVLCPLLMGGLVAWRQIYLRADTWYDRFAGTQVVRVERDRPPMTEVAGVMAPSPPEPSRQNYIMRHWRGQLSLPLSYWVNGTLLGFLAGVAVAAASALLFDGGLDDHPTAGLTALLMIWLILALLMLWQNVGIWRSATVYRASGRPGWGGVAKVMVLLGIVGGLWNFVSHGLPQIAEIGDIATGDQRLGPHRFQVLAYGEMLEFSGGIKFGVARELAELLDAMPDVKTVRLNSQGGRIREAQRMSDLIKARGLSTLVEQTCLSACTIVFLGGTDRAVMWNARLGFHQPSYRGLSAADRRAAIELEENRLQKFGLSRDFAVRANQAEPSSMWYPESRELLRENVATRIVGGPPKPAAMAPASPFTSTQRGTTPRAAVIPADVLDRFRTPPKPASSSAGDK